MSRTNLLDQCFGVTKRTLVEDQESCRHVKHYNAFQEYASVSQSVSNIASISIDV